MRSVRLHPRADCMTADGALAMVDARVAPG
jgi:hypothetical protein